MPEGNIGTRNQTYAYSFVAESTTADISSYLPREKAAQKQTHSTWFQRGLDIHQTTKSNIILSWINYFTFNRCSKTG